MEYSRACSGGYHAPCFPGLLVGREGIEPPTNTV